MKQQIVTTGIVLTRIEYQEADRILTMLTPDQGKLRLIAKGVRRPKSKLAGGIELFSISDITYVPGRGEIGTLISTRLIKYYGLIVQDIHRTMLGYELIKRLNKTTEDEPETDYFDLLKNTFAALDDKTILAELIDEWFLMQLLGIAGHRPNLETDTEGHALQADTLYDFDFDAMTFVAHPNGNFQANQIKFLRAGFADNQPGLLQKITGLDKLITSTTPLVRMMTQTYLRV